MKHISFSFLTIALLSQASGAELESTPQPNSTDHSHHPTHESADHHAHHLRPDAMAPVGVMGSHTHSQGEWMLSAKFMHMSMEGLMDGADELSDDALLRPFGTYGSIPTSMTMDMAMVGGMYGLTDWLTIGVMAHYHWKEMDMALRMVPSQFGGGHHHGSSHHGGGEHMGDHMGGDGHMPANMGGHMGGHHMDHNAALARSIISDWARGELGLSHPLGFYHTTLVGETTMKTQGLGDISLAGLFPVLNTPGHHVHVKAGVSIPTGSITETGVTPMTLGNETLLPYRMQLGSGTWDILAGMTYTGQTDVVSWGAQVDATIRTGRNSQGYRLGDQASGTVWLGWNALTWVSPNVRLKYSAWGNITGTAKDLQIHGGMTPTADPDNQGGHQAQAGAGLNFMIPSGVLAGNRLSFEYLLPVYENLDGPQMSAEGMLIAGWSWMF